MQYFQCYQKYTRNLFVPLNLHLVPQSVLGCDQLLVVQCLRFVNKKELEMFTLLNSFTTCPNQLLTTSSKLENSLSQSFTRCVWSILNIFHNLAKVTGYNVIILTFNRDWQKAFLSNVYHLILWAFMCYRGQKLIRS